MRNLAIICCLLLVTGCEHELEPRTQLLLVADTDIARVDQITFAVTGADGTTRVVGGEAGAGPRTLTLLHEKGPLSPVVVRTTGLSGNEPLVTRDIVTAFLRGQSRIVPVFLSKRCERFACPEAQTCIDGACRTTEVDPSMLPVWSGGEPSIEHDSGIDAGLRRDAGPSPAPDASAGAPDAAARADAATGSKPDAGQVLDLDASTPGQTGVGQCGSEQVDLSSNIAHCGGCEVACTVANASQHFLTRCTAGACDYRCQLRWGNCDNARDNGCETDLLTDEANCGKCERTCAANQTCRVGKCIAQ